LTDFFLYGLNVCVLEQTTNYGLLLLGKVNNMKSKSTLMVCWAALTQYGCIVIWQSNNWSIARRFYVAGSCNVHYLTGQALEALHSALYKLKSIPVIICQVCHWLHRCVQCVRQCHGEIHSRQVPTSYNISTCDTSSNMTLTL